MCIEYNIKPTALLGIYQENRRVFYGKEENTSDADFGSNTCT